MSAPAPEQTILRGSGIGQSTDRQSALAAAFLRGFTASLGLFVAT